MSSKIYGNGSLIMAMMAAMSESSIMSTDNFFKSPTSKYKYNFSIPKGAKLYLFENSGSFESFTEFASRNEMPNYCVFHTIAINDKSAISKFTKFKQY
jgi:hypothetical protein